MEALVSVNVLEGPGGGYNLYRKVVILLLRFFFHSILFLFLCYLIFLFLFSQNSVEDVKDLGISQ